jgi:hypothetical protein
VAADTLWTSRVSEISEATRGLEKLTDAELAAAVAKAVEETRDEVERRTRPYRQGKTRAR